MKKFLVASALLAMFAVVNPAFAARPKTLPVAAGNWSGCYAGGHLGGAWSPLHITDVGRAGFAFAASGAAGQVFTMNLSTVEGGGQVGCNRKAGGSVVGIESDLGWMGLSGSTLDPGTNSNTRAGIDGGLYGDIAGRYGVPLGKTLFYGKGGWAFFDGKQTFSTQAPGFVSNTDVGLFSGLTVGAGVERRLRSNWSGKVEYAYFWFPSQTFNTVNTSGMIFPFSEKLGVNRVQVGVNYKFGGGRSSAKH